MKNYYSASTFMLCGFCGAMAFAFAILIVEPLYAVFFALVFTLTLLLVIPAALFINDKKYQFIEKDLGDEIIENISANCFSIRPARNGHLYALKYMLYFVFLDKKPYGIIKLPYFKMHSVRLSNKTKLQVTMDDGCVFAFAANDAQKIYPLIKLSPVDNQFHANRSSGEG